MSMLPHFWMSFTDDFDFIRFLHA